MSMKLQWHGDRAKRNVHDRVEERTRAAAEIVKENAIKRITTGARSGHVYPLPNGVGTYRASAAGEAPASVSGNLAEAITINGFRRDDKLEMVVGVNARQAPYAQRLEYGFVGTDKLGRLYRQAPRPFLRPAYEYGRKQMIELIQRGR